MTPALIRQLRERLSRAHLAVRVANMEPGHSPTESALLDAITELGLVAVALVDELEEACSR